MTEEKPLVRLTDEHERLTHKKFIKNIPPHFSVYQAKRPDSGMMKGPLVFLAYLDTGGDPYWTHYVPEGAKSKFSGVEPWRESIDSRTCNKVTPDVLCEMYKLGAEYEEISKKYYNDPET